MRRDHQQTAQMPAPTRIERARPKPAAPAPASPPPVPQSAFAERLAMFVTGVDRARVDELLSGLSEPTRDSATGFAREAMAWDSASRQGRMAVMFGQQSQAHDRLKKLVAGASPALRSAIFGQLAPWQQSLFPRLRDAATVAVTPALEALATRLIREATR